MATEPKAFDIQIDPDARFAAAVGGATRYLADLAGLNEHAVAQLQSAVVAACLEAFDHLTGDDPHLDVKITSFTDRIEVALAHHGESLPAVGLGLIAGFATHRGETGTAPGGLAGVDRVQYETHGGETVTRLTKYIGRVAPKL